MSDVMSGFPVRGTPLPPPGHDPGLVWSVVTLVSVVLLCAAAARVWWCARRAGRPVFVPESGGGVPLALSARSVMLELAAFWLGVGGLVTSMAAPTGSVLATVGVLGAWALTGLWIVLRPAYPAKNKPAGGQETDRCSGP